MSHHSFFGFVAFLVLDIAASNVCSDADFGYRRWGQSEYSWPGVCQTGKRQSPVHLSLQSAMLNFTTDLRFFGYDVNTTDYTLINNGHTVKVRFGASKSGEIGVIHAGQSYRLLQLHFHWPSEHVIGGRRHPLEMHLVHQEVKSGKLLVVAALYKLHKRGNAMLSKLSSRFDEVAVPSNKSIFERNPRISLAQLLPVDVTQNEPSYYSYEGSLTTPPCTEGVKWIILLNPSGIDVFTLYRFEKVKRCKKSEGADSEEEEQFLQRGNFRPTQTLNGRRVTLHADLLF